MSEYISRHFGFSWIGLAVLLMLFVPNIVWARTDAKKFSEISQNEPGWLVVLERLGEALACVGLLFTKSLRLTGFSADAGWLAAAAVLMVLYEAFWARYFAGERTPRSFYRPFLQIRVPGAVFPVAALICCAVYAHSIVLAVAACLLGVGHIGIHLLHAASLDVLS